MHSLLATPRIAFAAVMIAASGVAHGALIDVTVRFEETGTFLIDFAPDTFTIRNDSSPGVTIDFVGLTFATAIDGGGAIFFDTVAGGPGTVFSFPLTPLAVTGGDPGVGFAGFPLFQAGLDGTSTLLLPFSDFDAGEVFAFSGDLDDDDATVLGFNTLLSFVVVDLGGVAEGRTLFGFFDEAGFFFGQTRITALAEPASVVPALAVGLVLLGATYRGGRRPRVRTLRRSVS